MSIPNFSDEFSFEDVCYLLQSTTEESSNELVQVPVPQGINSSETSDFTTINGNIPIIPSLIDLPETDNGASSSCVNDILDFPTSSAAALNSNISETNNDDLVSTTEIIDDATDLSDTSSETDELTDENTDPVPR